VINAYKVLVGKPEEIPRHRWQDDIKMDPKEIRCMCVV
jgi:hypothetical protein